MKFITTIIILLAIMSSSISKYKRMSTRRYMSRFDFPNLQKSTPPNADGGGQTIYLDRHNIDCGIGALNAFRFARVGSNKFKYDYKCIMPLKCNASCKKRIAAMDKKRCKVINTKYNAIGKENGYSTNYLDRHYLKCPAGFVMKHFHFLRKVPKRIFFKYTCCPASTSDCSSFNTNPTDYGGFQSIYLDRQNVHVKNLKTQAITGFKLNVNYKTRKYTYKVDYCTVSG